MRRLIWSLLWLLALFVLLGLALRTLGSRLLHDVQRQARMDNAEMLEVALQHAFLTNDFEMVQHMVMSAGSYGETAAVRLVSREGEVLASTRPDEIGVRLDPKGEQCASCHEAGATQLATSGRLRPPDGHEETFITANRIDNKIACQQCHAGEQPGLGVILVENRATSLDGWLARLDRWLLAGGFATYAVLAAGRVASTHLRAAPGRRWLPDAETSLPPLGKELLPAGQGVADFQQRAFDALLSISEAIDEELNAAQVFHRALQAVGEATGFNAVAMRYYDAENDSFPLIAQQGMSAAMVQELAVIPANRGFQAEVVRTKKPAVTSDLATDPRLGGRSALEMGYRSLASVPLLADGEIMGTMELASPQVYEWTSEQIRWLSLVGRTVGVFLHQAKLTTHLRDLAVLKERSFIAQEIHDGLAQLIGSIYVWAEDAQLSLEASETEAAQLALKRIDRTARDAYAVVREEMLGLRDVPGPGEDLIPYLEGCLDRFQRQWGIAVELEGVGDDRTLPVSVTPAAKIQLLRILQEVLTNVRRHAEATRVRLAMADKDGWLSVTIEDDGRGFDPQQVGSGHLGLGIMRERAASVGGRLSVTSQPGQGTHIEVQLPSRSNR